MSRDAEMIFLSGVLEHLKGNPRVWAQTVAAPVDGTVDERRWLVYMMSVSAERPNIGVNGKWVRYGYECVKER